MSNLYVHRVEFEQRMDSLNFMMRDRRLPKELCRRLRLYDA